MKKITLLFSLALSSAAFAQDCAVAEEVVAGVPYTLTTFTGTDLPLEDCTENEDDAVDAANWYLYTATIDGVAIISANKESNDVEADDTRLTVYTGTCDNLVCYGAADDVSYPSNVTSELIIPVTAGSQYYIVWDNQWEGFWVPGEEGYDWDINELPVDCTTTIPTTQDFSDAISFAVCHTAVDGDENGVAWIQQALDLDEDGNDETFATNGTNGDVAKDDWLFSPAFALEGGEGYTITATYNGANGANDANEDMEIVMTNEASPAATFQEVIGSATGITQEGDFADLLANATTGSYEFYAPTTGDYHIAFHTTTPENGGFLLLFNYTIDISLSNPGFETSTVKMHPNPTSSILNIMYAEVINSVEIFNLLGQKVASQTANANNVAVNMSDLATGAYTVKVTTASGTTVNKVIKN